MAIDFLAMLNEQREAEKASPATKKEEHTNTSKNKKSSKAVKQEQKNENKKKSFSEQYAEISNNAQKVGMKKVIDYLLTLDDMKEKMEDERVSIDGMWEYIRDQARKQAKNSCAVIEDEVVYGWGRHYYDEYGNVAK